MIRRLRDDEPIPLGEPRRYTDSAGYIVLRWRVAPGEYLDIREHRLVAGRPPGKHVHHRDGNKTNNHPDNLLCLTKSEHRAHHADERKFAPPEELRRLYEEGWSTPQIAAKFGVQASTILRTLRKRGVRVRSISESKTQPISNEEILRLHGQGLRPDAIASELGCGPCLVRRRLKAMGVAGYPPGRPAPRPIVHRQEAKAEGWIR